MDTLSAPAARECYDRDDGEEVEADGIDKKNTGSHVDLANKAPFRVTISRGGFITLPSIRI